MTRPALIGLDGRSGSGKTVLAAALAARIAPFARVEVIEIESMYRGWDGLAAAVGDDGPYPAVVRALRERGIDAWGIENNKGIHAKTPEALKEYNKLGSVTDLPFTDEQRTALHAAISNIS